MLLAEPAAPGFAERLLLHAHAQPVRGRDVRHGDLPRCVPGIQQMGQSIYERGWPGGDLHCAMSDDAAVLLAPRVKPVLYSREPVWTSDTYHLSRVDESEGLRLCAHSFADSAVRDGVPHGARPVHPDPCGRRRPRGPWWWAPGVVELGVLRGHRYLVEVAVPARRAQRQEEAPESDLRPLCRRHRALRGASDRQCGLAVDWKFCALAAVRGVLRIRVLRDCLVRQRRSVNCDRRVAAVPLAGVAPGV